MWSDGAPQARRPCVRDTDSTLACCCRYIIVCLCIVSANIVLGLGLSEEKPIGAPCVSDNLPTGLDARKAVGQKVYGRRRVGQKMPRVPSSPRLLPIDSGYTCSAARDLSTQTIPPTSPTRKPRRSACSQDGKGSKGCEGKQEDEAEGPGQGCRTPPAPTRTSRSRSPGAGTVKFSTSSRHAS